MEAAGSGHSHRRANTRNLDAEHVSVHPQLINTNATCHKWAFGAIAELVDNAVSEIGHGATFIHINRIEDRRNNGPALQITYNGIGLSPNDLNLSMTFPTIAATSFDESVLGHYQSGLKTTTMRLGADAVVFTVCPSSSTASVGLLSYTFAAQTDQKDTIVPILNYRTTKTTSGELILLRMLNESNKGHWNNLLNIILEWSPYSTELELLDVLDKIGDRGTRIIVYNLWRNKDGETELDFESRDDDIQITTSPDENPKPKKLFHFLHQQHIADRFRYSLRAYLSILYLRWPNKSFSISLRGKSVEHYDLDSDMKFSKLQVCNLPEVIDGTNSKPSVTARLGFVKEAPLINIRGFNMYYQNRLIVPFWRSNMSPALKGIVGIVEADCLKPLPGKEEFERSPISSLLESRIIQMSTEFWKSKSHMVTFEQNAVRVGGTAPEQIQLVMEENRNLKERLLECGELEERLRKIGEIVGGTAPEQIQTIVDENRILNERLLEFVELKENLRKIGEIVGGTAPEQIQTIVDENMSLNERLHEFVELKENLRTIEEKVGGAALEQIQLLIDENRNLKVKLLEYEELKEKMRKIIEMTEGK